MGRPLRIGLYSPFFGSTYGGGEKYLGVTAEALREAFPLHRIEILSQVPADREKYQRMLALDLTGVELTSVRRRVTFAHRALNAVRFLRLYRNLFVTRQAARFTQPYDLFLSMVYVLPAVTRARRSVILCQFPYRRGWRPGRSGPLVGQLFWLYSLPYRLLHPLLSPDEIDRFQEIVCQSEYVRHWVAAYWERDSLVVNPPIDIPPEEPDWSAKQNVVLSVGRFFALGHSKRHDLMVEAFRRLCDDGLQGWELHLAGSLHHERRDQEYFARIQARAEGYPISLHPDASYDTVQDLYRKASIYWHAAGYGVDAGRNPIDLEHFGMTTAEAMAQGVVPVAIARGGQPEVVRDGIDGYLWRDLEELRSRTLELVQDPGRRQHLALRAREASTRFSRLEFKRRMVAALAPIVRALEAEAAGASAGAGSG